MKLPINSTLAFVVISLNILSAHASDACYIVCVAADVVCCATASGVGLFVFGVGIPGGLAACSVILMACISACGPGPVPQVG
ncbi:hypothetical protein AG1IA_04547 [Rhizoctonia solani AG-1 IA]|uniref:Uncharacterized protein n=1 Tax=Thanatephorus cucumeris (strain AG1-IA) TaxID=983506 RepID=L8WYI3_THACA|nr:hypothetical protein AG1IA_04547 [Rhizoctonia solani AG-1 IA]